RAHRRPDRRSACRHRRSLRRRARQLRHDRAEHGDRRPRQSYFRKTAARALRGGPGSVARSYRLVPAQRRSGQGPGRDRGTLSRRHRRRRGGALGRPVGGGLERAARPAGEAWLDGAVSAESLSARVARQAKLVEAGVPEDLAGRLANLPWLMAAPDIVLVADRTGKPIGEVAATYFAAGAYFRLDRIASAAASIPVTDYFDRLALDRARDSIGD